MADGGVIFANAAVNLAAPYVALGASFLGPVAPQFITSAFMADGQPFYIQPSYGAGSLTVRARLIDIGNLTLQGIGQADLIAANGDIRGDGTLDIAGRLKLTAGQIYPTTGVDFTIDAHDYASGGAKHSGMIAIEASGAQSVPLSAGGLLSLYASVIEQGGAIRAPMGSIDLGWNGTGTAPTDEITGKAVAASRSISLLPGSLTSVSAVDPTTSAALTIPYGANLNGVSWIDPAGTDITATGVPQKSIRISAASVDDQSGSLIDIRGGGYLYSYRFVPGLGGSQDILASAGSFAVVPGYEAVFAPVDPGYANSALAPGASVYLNASPGLAAGLYTLLPARYALLPGAFLLTPRSGLPAEALSLPGGSSFVSGYRTTRLTTAAPSQPLLASFEVDPPAVVQARAEYDGFYANTFFPQNSSSTQRLPTDSGHLALEATQAMAIRGALESKSVSGGLGGLVDISSPADILIAGPGVASAPGKLVLDAAELNAFGADSLLVGGVRLASANGVSVTVTTNNVTLDNAGSPLAGPDITLVANKSLALAPGAEIEQSGELSGPAETFFLGNASVAGSGDGVLLRASGDPSAKIVRRGVNASAGASISVGAGAKIVAASLTLDSTHASALDPAADLSGQSITLGSGQISIQLGDPGALNPTSGLVLSGLVLQNLQNARSLSLLSYSSLDVYGAGNVGGAGSLANLSLHAAEIRGFNNGGGTAAFSAQNIELDNAPNGAVPGSHGAPSGTLVFNAGTLELGANTLAIDQFANLELNASAGILADGVGGIATQGALAIVAPEIAGATAASQTLAAKGALSFRAPAHSPSTPLAAGLGAELTLQGASVTVQSGIQLPSGALTLHATSGNVTVAAGSDLDAGGVAKKFFDLVKTTDGGSIQLIADAGNVHLDAGSALSVAAPAAGGNAGSLFVSAPSGSFALDGVVHGEAGEGGESGSFSLDAGALPGGSLASLDAALNSGGFDFARVLRIRTGDLVAGGLAKARTFILSADGGSITVSGIIDASGAQGGTIDLAAAGSVILDSGAQLNAAGRNFSSAGKGGAVTLEAGAEVNGNQNANALVNIQAGSTIDLSVAGNTESSSAAGDFTGALNLRAPQTAGNASVQIAPIDGAVVGASSVVIQGVQLYDLTPANGSATAAITSAVEQSVYNNGQTFAGNAAAISAALLGNNAKLASVLHVEPAADILNRTGDLTLASSWDLSKFRFGSSSEPGVLTLRAAGNLSFDFGASLSDGFDGSAGLWLAPLLAAGERSWSFRLVAGADFSAADFRQSLALNGLSAAAGSLLLGANAGAHSTLPVATNNSRLSILKTYFQTIRTGSGDIDIYAARDVRLLNSLATIYTAGIQAPALAHFDLPNVVYQSSGVLGPVQSPFYQAQYSFGGGNVTISAQNNIIHETASGFGPTATVSPDSSRELPDNWLYRRGYVNPATGEFDITHNGGNVESTSWWIDFSNFFEGVGALGGGDVTLLAGHDVSNVDAVVPTNARMPKGVPNASHLVELGGGDLTLHAGRDINGGVYYVERGNAVLSAGNSVRTNSTRAAMTQLDLANAATAPDPTSWLPTAFFLGKGIVDVTARGDVLIGPVANPFLLPQGIDNSYFNKTYFSTYATTDAVNVSSLTGKITVKSSADGGAGSLANWYENVLSSDAKTHSFSQSQPWLRIDETDPSQFATISSLMPGALRATAFSGDINLVGGITLSPSPTGTVDLIAAGSINGVQPNGVDVNGERQWGSSRINLSDADPLRVPGIASPVSLSYLGTDITPSKEAQGWNVTPLDFTALTNINALFNESGATEGAQSVLQTKQALHASGPLHAGDANPVHLYAETGDISGFTLFSGKAARIVAGQDVTDIAFYVQNNGANDLTAVEAGRDLIAYDPASPLRTEAQAAGNELFLVANEAISVPASGTPNAGDIQISGPGALEVLAGRNINLGVGPEAGDGTQTGVSSVGNARNPYLPFAGASVIVGAGIGNSFGLAGSRLDFNRFIDQFLNPASAGAEAARYLPVLGGLLGTQQSANASDVWADFERLSVEKRAELALQIFYLVLRDAGRDHGTAGSPGFGNYKAGFAAISALFSANGYKGGISLTSREIKTESGGGISLFAPGGDLAVGYDIAGNQSVDQGILTEDGGDISIFAHGDVSVGTSRIFTLRGGNATIWSSAGNIAAGASAKTVQSAPPTRVEIDPQSGDVKTDLAGLATGGGIGVLESVSGVPPGNVDLIAPVGVIDAGDAGIRVSGNLTLAAATVLNAGNIQVSGASQGVPAAVVAPSLAGASIAASTTAGAGSAAASQTASQNRSASQPPEEIPSIITVEVIGYGGGDATE